MKDGVENYDVRYAFTACHRIFDTRDVARVMKRSQRAYLLDFFDNLGRYDHGVKKALAAVHYPVPDAV